MQLQDARVLVAGATGEVGRRMSAGLADRGARVAVAGRDADRLAGVAGDLGAPSVALDVRDPASCRGAVAAAAEALGGLDALVVATGVAAFGPAEELADDVARALFETNVLGPMALVSEALRRMDGGAVVVFSAIVADYPTSQMAAYSASKAALSAFVAATRRERRRQGTQVLDVRPQHMETGFSDRALAGQAPPLPDPLDVEDVVAQVLDALPQATREIAYDLERGQLVAR